MVALLEVTAIIMIAALVPAAAIAFGLALLWSKKPPRWTASLGGSRAQFAFPVPVPFREIRIVYTTMPVHYLSPLNGLAPAPDTTERTTGTSAHPGLMTHVIAA
jgi:hypothetical protein